MYSEDGVFVANTDVAGSQLDPALALLTNGNMVVVWRSDQGDGSGLAIKAQIVTTAGDKVGVEFLVNTTSAGNQIDPVITALPSGNFLIVWTGPEIHAQLFAADGTKIGAEFVANSTTANDQMRPTVEALGNGGFVISYESDINGSATDSLRARVFNASGTPLGPDFVVPTSPDPNSLPVMTNDFVDQEITALAGGGFLITWLMDRTVSDPDFAGPGNPGGQRSEDSVMGRLFAADGTPLGAEFTISEGTKKNLDDPTVVPLSSGGFIAIWYQFSSLTGGSNGTMARFLDAAGNPIGSEFVLVPRDVGDTPEAIPLPQGGFLLSLRDDGDQLYQIFDNAGQPVDGAFRPIWDGSRDAMLALPDGTVFVADAATGNGAVEFDIFVHRLRLPITLTGGPGDDIYIIENPGDSIVEGPGQGYDVAYSYVSYTLADDTEVEGLSTITWERTEPIDLTGNSIANYLIGNAGRNRLDGAGGADVMQGREGNDDYVVDSLGDQVIEAAGGGSDAVYTSISFALSDNAEIEGLSTILWEATTAIDLTGNSLGNNIIGNAGRNRIDGGAGNDVMTGREGDDIYLADSALDRVFEFDGGGYDVIYTAVSYALTFGSRVEGLSTLVWEATDAINLTGNSTDNYLIGNAGANVLDGLFGNDVLQGREGADTFVFSTQIDHILNVDVVFDFSADDDMIALDDAAFTNLAPGALPANAFTTGTAAQDADDRIIYNPATGQLFYDMDGSGTAHNALPFAVLTGAPAITASDFTVI